MRSTEPTCAPTDVGRRAADVHLVGDVGVERVRHVRRQRDRGDALDLVAERDREVRRGLDPRAGHGVPAERLEGDADLDRGRVGRERQ